MLLQNLLRTTRKVTVNTFQGELADVSAGTKTLASSGSSLSDLPSRSPGKLIIFVLYKNISGSTYPIIFTLKSEDRSTGWHPPFQPVDTSDFFLKIK